MWSDNREKVELSGTIKERCEEAIRLDPTSDLALHVLGRYQHQMANLGRIVRALVRVMYGGKLEPGTLEEAETIFRRAIEIAPKRLIHRVELGKLLLDMQRKDEAHAELKLAMTLPREDINSEHERRDAVELLKKHWGEKVEIPQFADPPPTPPPRLSSVSRRSSFDGGARRSFDDVRENPFLTKAAQQAAAA
jgi:tetratricopeptide (TPR) repeat protein